MSSWVPNELTAPHLFVSLWVPKGLTPLINTRLRALRPWSGYLGVSAWRVYASAKRQGETVGIVHAITTGYRMGQAGKLVRALLVTYGGCTDDRAHHDAIGLVRVAYRKVEEVMAIGQHVHPHAAAVAAYALAGGVSLGTDDAEHLGVHYACCAALTGHLAELTPLFHRYRFGALDTHLFETAVETLAKYVPMSA